MKAETVIAAALMALSIWFMISAAQLPIGWVRGTGPGGGSFPFWLSAVMLAASTLILLRNIRLPAAGPFFDPDTRVGVAVVSAVLLATIFLIPIVGAYVAIVLFLLVYLKAIGRHRWIVVLPLVVLTPVFLFFFFEVTLRILLPKGLTEPFFLPLYATFF